MHRTSSGDDIPSLSAWIKQKRSAYALLFCFDPPETQNLIHKPCGLCDGI